MKELKETACQLEEEKLSSQKQTRLALARAVSAEIEADQVAVLKQQLAQTKTNHRATGSYASSSKGSSRATASTN